MENTDGISTQSIGQETTSNLLSFTLITLLKNPDILERLDYNNNFYIILLITHKYSVVSEIDEVMGDKDILSSNDLDKLTYTNAVSIFCK